MGNSLTVSYKVTRTLSIQLSNFTPSFYPTAVKTWHKTKNNYTGMFVAVLFKIAPNQRQSRSHEQVQEKQIVVYASSGILLSGKKV